MLLLWWTHPSRSRFVCCWVANFILNWFRTLFFPPWKGGVLSQTSEFAFWCIVWRCFRCIYWACYGASGSASVHHLQFFGNVSTISVAFMKGIPSITSWTSFGLLSTSMAVTSECVFCQDAGPTSITSHISTMTGAWENFEDGGIGMQDWFPPTRLRMIYLWPWFLMTERLWKWSEDRHSGQKQGRSAGW